MRATERSRKGSRPRPAVAAAAVALSVLLVTAGCTNLLSGGSAAPGSGSPEVTEPLDRVHRQAHDALVRWADAVRASGGATITFTGELTSQIGDWAAGEGDNKSALLAGLVEAEAALSNDVPSRREVKWLDGRKVDVNVLSAVAALDDLVATAGGTECTGCSPLIVIEANLATGLVDTSDGPAEVPTWVFTLQGNSVRITRVAVDGSVTVVPPPWNADNPPVGISIESAVGEPDSRRLEVAFVGAREAADQPCGADYTAEAVESELAVVIIVNVDRGEGGCRLTGFVRTEEVRLDAELGERTVLEARQGLPVSVTAP